MNDLIEAYKGVYELGTSEATYKLRNDTPKERLEVYCQWEGLIGYAGRLYEIATGVLEEPKKAYPFNPEPVINPTKERARMERINHRFSDGIGGDSSNYRNPKF